MDKCIFSNKDGLVVYSKDNYLTVIIDNDSSDPLCPVAALEWEEVGHLIEALQRFYYDEGK